MFLIFPDTHKVAECVSAMLFDRIKQNPDIVLGLATGGTMEPIYQQFVARLQQEKIELSRLRSFNLDEYVGLNPQHPKSYAAYMHEHLFQHIGYDSQRHFLPDGLAPDLDEYCRAYSDKIRRQGGIDLQLLGVGTNGHIGFNEPGTPFDSRCHVVRLSERTRRDNSRFFAKGAIVPETAITMGMQDIMEARQLVLVATGSAKAETMARFYQSDVTPDVPITALKQHPDARIILDEAAASKLPDAVRRQYAVGDETTSGPVRRYA